MNSDLPSTSRWSRVGRRTPCPICGKPDWCTLSTDGTLACCMRVRSDRQLGNGGWLHRFSGHRLQTRPSDCGPPAAVPTNRAPIQQRDRVYRFLVRELGLVPGHRKHLQEVRGLPPAALEGFVSAPGPDRDRRGQIARQIIDRIGDEDILRGVPGFLVDRYGRWTCRGSPPGFLIPVPDERGRFQAFQVRFDRPNSDGQRYIWYSSRGRPGGSSPGVPVAVWRPELIAQGPAWLTEGPLKAAITAWHLRAHVIGVAGVSNWRPALDLIPPKAAAAIAFDSDTRTNPVVARHQLELARALFWAGHPVAIATWDPRYKGIDDAILAGVSINLEAWPRGSRAVQIQGASRQTSVGSLVENGQ